MQQDPNIVRIHAELSRELSELWTGLQVPLDGRRTAIAGESAALSSASLRSVRILSAAIAHTKLHYCANSPVSRPPSALRPPSAKPALAPLRTTNGAVSRALDFNAATPTSGPRPASGTPTRMSRPASGTPTRDSRPPSGTPTRAGRPPSALSPIRRKPPLSDAAVAAVQRFLRAATAARVVRRQSLMTVARLSALLMTHGPAAHALGEAEAAARGMISDVEQRAFDKIAMMKTRSRAAASGGLSATDRPRSPRHPYSRADVAKPKPATPPPSPRTIAVVRHVRETRLLQLQGVEEKARLDREAAEDAAWNELVADARATPVGASLHAPPEPAPASPRVYEPLRFRDKTPEVIAAELERLQRSATIVLVAVSQREALERGWLVAQQSPAVIASEETFAREALESEYLDEWCALSIDASPEIAACDVVDSVLRSVSLGLDDDDDA